MRREEAGARLYDELLTRRELQLYAGPFTLDEPPGLTGQFEWRNNLIIRRDVNRRLAPNA